MLSLIVGLIIWYLLRQRRAQPTITPAYPSGVSSLAQPYSPGAYEEPMMKFYVSHFLSQPVELAIINI